MDFKIKDEVCLIPGAVRENGEAIPTSLFGKKLYIRAVTEEGNYIVSMAPRGANNGTVKKEYVIAYEEDAFANSYLANALIDADIRAKPGIAYRVTGTLNKDFVYSIIEEKDGWGRLKMGGWVSLDEIKRI